MSRAIISKLILCCLLIFINGCMPASSSESLPESVHPYANSLADTNNLVTNWTVNSEPGTTEIQIHFENLDLSDYDKLIIYDQYGDVVETYSNRFGSGFEMKSFWTEWYVGDTLTIELIANEEGNDYGFKIDNISTRTGKCPPGSLPESYHNYANNFKYPWPAIIKSDATKIRIHFENLDLSDYDKLIIYDQYGDVVETYSSRFGSGFEKKNFWTDWYVSNTLTVELLTNEKGTDYGFKIDKGEITNAENVTSAFTTSETVSEKPSSITVYGDYIHNQSVDLAIALNILEEDDKESWVYKNIQWIFGGFGVSLITAIGKLLKRPKDDSSGEKKLKGKKSENKNSENN